MALPIDLVGTAFGGGMDDKRWPPGGKGRTDGRVVGQVEALQRWSEARMCGSDEVIRRPRQ